MRRYGAYRKINPSLHPAPSCRPRHLSHLCTALLRRSRFRCRHAHRRARPIPHSAPLLCRRASLKYSAVPCPICLQTFFTQPYRLAKPSSSLSPLSLSKIIYILMFICAKQHIVMLFDQCDNDHNLFLFICVCICIIYLFMYRLLERRTPLTVVYMCPLDANTLCSKVIWTVGY